MTQNRESIIAELRKMLNEADQPDEPVLAGLRDLSRELREFRSEFSARHETDRSLREDVATIKEKIEQHDLDSRVTTVEERQKGQDNQISLIWKILIGGGAMVGGGSWVLHGVAGNLPGIN